MVVGGTIERPTTCEKLHAPAWIDDPGLAIILRARWRFFAQGARNFQTGRAKSTHFVHLIAGLLKEDVL